MKVGYKMNEVERYETDLLAIIKEGKNLTEGYVEVKPGIRIRAGREREFERLCDNYYEQKFNQTIQNDTDTITPVYESLTKLVEEETEEYYVSKASEYVLEVKNEVERFKALVKSFNTVDNAYKLTVKNLNDLYLKRENTPEWQQRVDELNNELKRLTENTNILTEQIKNARRNVNETLIKYAEEQMAEIRNSFLKTTKEAAKAPAMDHNYILAGDKDEYDSLYRLTLILKHANEVEDFDKFVVVDDAMIVSEDQKDILTSSILPNIKLYGYIKAPEKKETNPSKEANNSFIAKVQQALNSLDELGKKDEKTAWRVMEEKEKIFDILKLINKANASDFALVGVWDDMAYVLADDKPKLLKLLNESSVFKNLNPDIEKRKQNEKLIEELYSYLDELANKVTEHRGVANLPIKSTNTVGDRAWAVLDNDWQEANRIIDIIKLLQNQTENLYPVWGIANLSANDMSKFKRLSNATKRFGDKVPNILENEAELARVREQLGDLIKKAKGANNAPLASNGFVLEADSELYGLLDEKYRYLEAAKASDNLVPIDGVLIDGDYAQRYHDATQKVDELLKVQAAVVNNVEPVPTTSEPIATASATVTPQSNGLGAASGISASSSSVTGTEENVNNGYVPIPDDKALVPIYNLNISRGTNAIDFSKNDKIITELKARLAALSAKSSHNELERKLFDVLSDQLEILENAKKSDKVVEINGLKFANEEDKSKYLTSMFILNELTGKLNLPKLDIESLLNPGSHLGGGVGTVSNAEKIAELKEEMAKLEPRLGEDELAQQIYALLGIQAKILEKAEKLENAIIDNGLKFASEEDKNEYFAAQTRLDEIVKELENGKGKKKGKIRKKITAIRDWFGNKFDGLGNKIASTRIGNFVVEHKHVIKLLVGAGLGIAAVTFVLPQIVPTIIFSNSCLASAIPALSGTFNAISGAIAPLAGISFAPGVGAINLGVNANLAGVSLANSLAKVGVVGLGAALAYKGAKAYNNRDNENRLSDPEKRNIIQKISDLIEGFNRKLQVAYIGVNSKADELFSKVFDRNKSEEEEVIDEVQKQIGEEVSAMLDEDEERKLQQIQDRADNLAPQQPEQDPTKPIVVVPSDEELNKALGEAESQTAQDPEFLGDSSTMSQEEIEKMLNGITITDEDINSRRIAALEEEAKKYQDIMDVTSDQETIDECKRHIAAINIEIERLKGKGRN